jgi:mono/diheme cytochrome c family protein
MKKAFIWIILGVIALLVIIQVLYLTQNIQNPPVVQEPNWDSPQTRELARRACFDCHSNDTSWPWYSKVIPIAWLVRHDVADGRRRLNFSEWNAGRYRTGEIVRILQEGEMPPVYYTLVHPSAHLSPAEMQSLAQGLSATFGATGSTTSGD